MGDARKRKPGGGSDGVKKSTVAAATSTANGATPKAAATAYKRRHKVYTPIPWLDNALTVLFLLEIGFSIYVFRKGVFLAAYLIALAITVVAIVVIKHGSISVGRALSALHPVTADNPHRPMDKIKTRRKFAEQAWQLAVHVSMGVLDWVVMDTMWWNDTRTIWIPHPDEQPLQPALVMLYIMQTGIWVYTCAIHRFVDSRRKDYFVMYIHHIVTIALVVMSAAMGFYRIGLLVLLAHDISDITVDLLKLCNYLDLSGPRFLFLTEIMFAVNMGMWIYWRLYQFPVRIIHAAFSVSHQVVIVEQGRDHIGLYWPTNLLLMALACLHVWWFYLFLKLAYGILTKGSHEAGRENYEGDSDDEEDESGAGGAADALPMWWCVVLLPVLLYAQYHVYLWLYAFE